MYTQEERILAMLAHLVGPLGYIGGVLQYVLPLIIYLMYRDRSRFVAFHALQSLMLQLLLLGLGVAVVVVSLLTCGLAAAVLAPLAGVTGLVMTVVVIVAAIQAFRGQVFEYWIVGPWARRRVGL